MLNKLPPHIETIYSMKRFVSRSKGVCSVSNRIFRQGQQHLKARTCPFSSDANRQSQAVGSILELSCGRSLGYHTSGNSEGTAVLYIHGNPDSGIQVTGELEERVAMRLGVHWIGPDRPGIGLSTKYKGQSVTDYPKDIRSLVDHLGLKQYYILGTSGGTGFALACAKDLPRDQLKGVGICAGVGPVQCGFESMGESVKKAWNLWEEYPAEMEAFFESEYAQERFASWFSGKDLGYMLQEDTLATAVKGFRQIYAQGVSSHARGIEINRKSWGFRLEDVKFPGIKFWYGSGDENTTPIMGRYMAERLPDSAYVEFPGKTI